MVEAMVLSNRYRLEERIAGGGMGSVYAATDRRLGRRVAAKLLREDLSTDPDYLERFRREARAAAALVHPNIAGVFDYGEDGGRPYIVMELVRGRDLAVLLRDEGPLAPERAVDIIVQVCDALGHAHSEGLVHRDVKPGNVLVSNEDRVKVTDFGIAHAAGSVTLTAAGSALGTAQYMSPEQASGSEVGPASDVYSTGVVLFEMLTGEVPFSGGTAVAVAMRHVSEDVPPPSARGTDVSSSLDDTVARATAKRPQDRFADGAAMARALRGERARGLGAATALLAPTTAPMHAAGGPTPVPAPTTETWPPSRSGPRSGIAARRIALALSALLLAVGIALYLSVAARDRTPQGAGAPARPQVNDTATSSHSPAPPVETVTVPGGLVGGNVDDAAGVLAAMGLKPARTNEVSDEPPDTVIAVRPPAGTEVPAGSTVTLVVSTGPAEPSPVPSASPSATESAGGGGGETPGKANGHHEHHGKHKEKGNKD